MSVVKAVCKNSAITDTRSVTVSMNNAIVSRIPPKLVSQASFSAATTAITARIGVAIPATVDAKVDTIGPKVVNRVTKELIPATTLLPIRRIGPTAAATSRILEIS